MKNWFPKRAISKQDAPPAPSPFVLTEETLNVIHKGLAKPLPTTYKPQAPSVDSTLRKS